MTSTASKSPKGPLLQGDGRPEKAGEVGWTGENRVHQGEGGYGTRRRGRSHRAARVNGRNAGATAINIHGMSAKTPGAVQVREGIGQSLR